MKQKADRILHPIGLSVRYVSALLGSGYGASRSASAAVNARICVNNKLAVTLGNRSDRTSIGASATSDTIIRNYICHDTVTSLFILGGMP